MRRRVITETAIKAFQEHLTNDEKSENTISKYLYDVRSFACFLGSKVIDKGIVMEYKEKLGRKYAPTSANSMIAALNAFLRFMEWYDCCVKQFKIQRKAHCSEETELSKSDYLALVRAAEKKQNERLSLLIQTICGTGIRVSEVSFITVEAAQCGEAIVSCKGKTRTVFIVSALRKKLLKYAKDHNIKTGVIFVTKSGKPMNRSNIWREMKELCEQAGVSACKVFPHNLRHLFARTFYGIEKDIAKLADILGHSNINTTRIYIITTGAEHKRKMENMRLII